MQALIRPFTDGLRQPPELFGLRQPPELFSPKIRRRVRCTKRFCCSAAKPGMHVVNTESLRVFRALPDCPCTYSDRELLFRMAWLCPFSAI